MLFKDTFEGISDSFNSWADASPTDAEYVSNLTLEYANRAQECLLSEAASGWQYLTKTVLLTVTNNVATLPTDYGVLIHCFDDADQDGKPDHYYFKDGELLSGFVFSDPFTKAAGHSFSLSFYESPLEPLYAQYQSALEDFTGEGTEYSFFPKNLLLRKMQHLRCLDKSMLDEWKALSADYQIELGKFKTQHQNVSVPIGMQINDSRGAQIHIPRYRLGGVNRRTVGRTNDTDVRV